MIALLRYRHNVLSCRKTALLRQRQPSQYPSLIDTLYHTRPHARGGSSQRRCEHLHLFRDTFYQDAESTDRAPLGYSVVASEPVIFADRHTFSLTFHYPAVA